MNDNRKTKQSPSDLKTGPKTKSKKLFWVLTVLAVIAVTVIIIAAMLFHTPSHYQPLKITDGGVMSVYLTNYLLPDFYNGVQYQQPFDLVVTQSGINDVVARFKWPRKFGSVDISDPVVFFTSDTMVVMATASVDGASLIATLIAEPKIDDAGLLNLHISAVKLGAMDITLLAKVFAADLYQKKNAPKDRFGDKAVRSMLYDEPFDPYFQIDDKKARLQNITLEPKKLTLSIVPVLDENVSP